MPKISQFKVVSTLPSTLEPDAVYYVRVGTGFDIYVTNSSGTVVAYPSNQVNPAPVTTEEAQAGTETGLRSWSPVRVWQAIAAWWATSSMKTKLDGVEVGAQVNAAAATQIEAETGTETGLRSWSPLRVRQAIAAWWTNQLLTANTWRALQQFNRSTSTSLADYCAEFIGSGGTSNAGRALFSQGATYGLAVSINSSGSPSAFVNFQWIDRSNGAVQSTPLSLTYSGNVLAQGYVRMGTAAPSVQMKKITGTTPATAGASATIAHGLTVGKIVDVRVLIETAPNQLSPAPSSRSGYQMDWEVVASGVTLIASASNSASVLGKPVRILITYEE